MKGPNINEALFDAICASIPEGGTLLELGSGETSAQFAERFTVYSIEHDEEWLNKYPSVNYIHAPLTPVGDGFKRAQKYFNQVLWYDAEIIKKHIPSHYDVLFVDGPPREFRSLFYFNWKLFNITVPWFFDDVHRPEWYRAIMWTARDRGFVDLPPVREIITDHAWLELPGRHDYGRGFHAK